MNTHCFHIGGSNSAAVASIPDSTVQLLYMAQRCIPAVYINIPDDTLISLAICIIIIRTECKSVWDTDLDYLIHRISRGNFGEISKLSDLLLIAAPVVHSCRNRWVDIYFLIIIPCLLSRCNCIKQHNSLRCVALSPQDEQ